MVHLRFFENSPLMRFSKGMMSTRPHQESMFILASEEMLRNNGLVYEARKVECNKGNLKES